MTSTLSALLYLGEFLQVRETESRGLGVGGNMSHCSCLPGLYLSQTISTQKQILSKPIIWAKPDFMIPKGMRVLILCQGTPEAVEYQLYFEGHLSAQQSPKQLGRRNIVMFHIPAMTLLTAGQYKCIYRSKELWSNPSDPLDLVITEMYDTPTLSVHPGPEVTSGKNVTFYCQLGTATNKFFLLKEGRSGRPQHRYGNTQVEFPMGPVTTAHRGTYRCFGSYNNHAWSFPSEPVKLLVTDVGDTSLAPTEHNSFSDLWDLDLLTTEAEFQQDLGLWDHTAQNLLRIGLAFLVLVALMCLLAEDWLWRKRAQEKANGNDTEKISMAPVQG
ncbi:natural cytotoxicity triggering receptor 1 isoform X2 [Callorhinus ursinus]|uniref:Natural cytotoxicity triggering receptor 1 n=1 Tax=Callorhinus ursinus TaxID=34884 RepID=A0A3Q7MDM5_CALUR|nr:natural cytotoxicity triggering receptor 1-like isoform X2 [Callorhinus ursinus]XP_025704927.1 natural cytotoxicity triggering receptor 1-like isoform X2 [Callorhinus ursinus]